MFADFVEKITIQFKIGWNWKIDPFLFSFKAYGLVEDMIPFLKVKKWIKSAISIIDK